MKKSSQRGPRMGFASGALAVLLVLAQGAELGHVAFAQHRRCAEHGEWIDVSESAAAHDPSVQETPSATLVQAAPQAPSAEPAHHHCEIAVLWHHQKPGTAGAGALAIAGPRLPPVHAQAREVPQPLDRLSVAPKQSPPV